LCKSGTKGPVLKVRSLVTLIEILSPLRRGVGGQFPFVSSCLTRYIYLTNSVCHFLEENCLFMGSKRGYYHLQTCILHRFPCTPCTYRYRCHMPKRMYYWPVHLNDKNVSSREDTFLSWHLAPPLEVAGGHTLPF
jgi:hypothetical protein